jgi:hypothetical protein
MIATIRILIILSIQKTLRMLLVQVFRTSVRIQKILLLLLARAFWLSIVRTSQLPLSYPNQDNLSSNRPLVVDLWGLLWELDCRLAILPSLQCRPRARVCLWASLQFHPTHLRSRPIHLRSPRFPRLALDPEAS